MGIARACITGSFRRRGAIVAGLLTAALCCSPGQAAPLSRAAPAYSAELIYAPHDAGYGTQLIREPIADAAGNLYGASPNGGSCGQGAIVRFSPRRPGQLWKLTNLHSFTQCRHKREEFAPTSIAFGRDGAIYGVTYVSGAAGGDGGALFRLTPDANGENWSYETLATAKSRGAIDQILVGGIVVGPDGSVFCLSQGARVLRFAPGGAGGSWSSEVIADLRAGEADSLGAPDQYSGGGLSVDDEGDVYGVALVSQQGTQHTLAFRLEPPAASPTWTTRILHRFEDGAVSYTPLLVGPRHTLVGTINSSSAQNAGYVFQLAPAGGDGEAWTYSVIHKFKESSAAGYRPYGALAMSGQDIIGVTINGGSRDTGVAFKLTPTGDAWKYKSIYDFAGFMPDYGLAKAPSGRLFVELIPGRVPTGLYELKK